MASVASKEHSAFATSDRNGSGNMQSLPRPVVAESDVDEQSIPTDFSGSVEEIACTSSDDEGHNFRPGHDLDCAAEWQPVHHREQSFCVGYSSSDDVPPKSLQLLALCHYCIRRVWYTWEPFSLTSSVQQPFRQIVLQRNSKLFHHLSYYIRSGHIHHVQLNGHDYETVDENLHKNQTEEAYSAEDDAFKR